MKKKLLILFISISFLLPSAAFANDPAVTITAAERKMAENITARQLSEYLHFVASDAMGGRNTPSIGLDITAQFLALNLKRWGFKPAGDNGTFFQDMELTGGQVDPVASSLTIGGTKYNYGKDFFAKAGAGKASGGLVFGNHGWYFKAKGVDPYKGLDLKGKIVVLLSSNNPRGFPTSVPKGTTNKDFGGKRGTDWMDPVAYARKKGAVGIIAIASAKAQSNWDRIMKSQARGRVRVAKFSSSKPLPTVFVSSSMGKSLFEGESSNPLVEGATPKPFEMSSSKTANFVVGNKGGKLKTQNVVAIWEGSDPELKKEMVAVGAHYDHVGTRPNAKGDDKIWNGADDDGSGTVAVLSIAEALAKAKVRPKRSILLVWHAGEEKGLWGAKYFNQFPTVNIKNVVAQLNIDMIGRSKKEGDTNPKNKDLSGPNEIYVIGSEMMSSKLGEITKGTNDSYLKMKYNYRYDDPKDTNRFFFRSDHFHYAQNGIPISFWFDGVHEDYHGAGDHPDKIDYQKMEKVTRTIFLTMWGLSKLNERPAVDKKLPPELRQR